MTEADTPRRSRQPEGDSRAISERLGDGIVERLRLQAKTTTEVSQLLAADKTARNRAAGDPLSNYQGMAVEQTLEWRAADRIEALEAALREAITKFREYETLHAAKGNLDGDSKARANAEIADRLASSLSLPVQRGEG